MSKNSHQNNSSNSLSHTHTISKSAVRQPKLTNVYQLDEENTDLKKSRAFELEWVVQIHFLGQWLLMKTTNRIITTGYSGGGKGFTG
jgi:hypothetical protein